MVRTNWTKKRRARYERKNSLWSDPDLSLKKFFAVFFGQGASKKYQATLNFKRVRYNNNHYKEILLSSYTILNYRSVRSRDLSVEMKP